MVKKYEDFFRSEADGLEISALCICPEQKPYRAIIQLVHCLLYTSGHESDVCVRYRDGEISMTSLLCCKSYSNG